MMAAGLGNSNSVNVVGGIAEVQVVALSRYRK